MVRYYSAQVDKLTIPRLIRKQYSELLKKYYWKPVLVRGKEESISVNDAISTNNGEVAVDWALAGCGILLRSEWDIGNHLAAGKLQRVLPEYSQPAGIYAVYPAELRDTHKIKTIVDFFRERI